MVVALPPTTRHDRIRAAILAELDTRRLEVDGDASLTSITLVVSLCGRGLVRRVTWRTEAVTESDHQGQRGR